MVPLGEPIRRTPGAHRSCSIDDLRCDAFGTEAELAEFLAFVAESLHGARENEQQNIRLRNRARRRPCPATPGSSARLSGSP